MTVSVNDFSYLRLRLNISHLVRSELILATVTFRPRTSPAPQSQHLPAVSKHASMPDWWARSSHIELVLFASLCTDARSTSTPDCSRIRDTATPEEGSCELSLLTNTSDGPQHLSSFQQSGGRVALSRAEPHGRASLDVLTRVAMKLPGTLSSLVSDRIFGWGTLRCTSSCGPSSDSQ